ncbi:MAG: ABC transporter permease [Firmicutes bacterium]|nr:ABC transporter permease [Bacillota bacterium]
MLKYIIKRVIFGIIILLGVGLITYAALRLMPTDFLYEQYRLGHITWETYQEMYYGLGFNHGVFGGFFVWLGSAFQGNFGLSFFTNRPVMEEIFSPRMGITVMIVIISMIFQLAIAIPLGITSAVNQYSKRDYSITFIVMMLFSFPSFFLAALLVMVFAVWLGWFPTQGMFALGLSPAATFFSRIHHLILPIMTVVLISLGGTLRFTRMNTLEVLSADYIRTARAKGCSERVVVYKHAFRNTLVPFVTSMATLLPGLFSGSIILEQFFAIEGLGNLVFMATRHGDVPLMMAYNMFLAILTVVSVTLADLMYAVVDPRIKITK